jgi:hypothetical protein
VHDAVVSGSTIATVAFMGGGEMLVDLFIHEWTNNFYHLAYKTQKPLLMSLDHPRP